MSTVNIDTIDSACWLTYSVSLLFLRKLQTISLEFKLVLTFIFSSQFWFMPVKRSPATHWAHS